MECDPTRVCELLVGLGDVEVLGVDDEEGEPLRVHIRRRTSRPVCEGCGGLLWSDGERTVELVDLAAFGRPARLVWHKRRWRCAQRCCGAGTVTEQDPAIAPARERLTTRAGRWATRRAGCGDPLKDIASELGCSWHRVNVSVRRWGAALLDADTERISQVRALGLDEVLVWRRGRFRTKAWGTTIVDAAGGQLLDIVAGRTAKAPTQWLLSRPQSWLDEIRWGVLDLSGPYRAAFDTALPDAGQVADPFHVVRLGNTALDEVRRRVQNQTLGPPRPQALTRCIGPASCWSRRLRPSPTPDASGCGACSMPATPTARSATPGTPKRPCARSMTSPTRRWAQPPSSQLACDLQDPGMPAEINRLGRTLWRWKHQIANWHTARVTNAATEAANNLVKRVKRAAFGFTNFANYRIRALLYAGKPNWALLDTLTPT